MTTLSPSHTAHRYLTQHGFYEPLDISNSVCRGTLYSYHPEAEEPILFRHYRHNTPRSADRAMEQSGRISCVLFFYLQGDLHFVTPNHLYHMTYGDIFLVREGEPFCGRCMSDTYVDYYEIDIPLSFFQKVADASFFRNLFYDRLSDTHNCLSMTEDRKAQCLRLLRQMETLLLENPQQNAMPAYACFIQIIQLLNHSTLSLSGNGLPVNSSPCIFRALEYIHSHLASLENIDEIAAYCHVSTSYLCRSFRKTMGSTLNDYIQSLRISHAKYLLQNGYDVSGACRESGFRTYSYFIQVFKAHVGMTPLKYSRYNYAHKSADDV